MDCFFFVNGIDFFLKKEKKGVWVEGVGKPKKQQSQ